MGRDCYMAVPMVNTGSLGLGSGPSKGNELPKWLESPQWGRKTSGLGDDKRDLVWAKTGGWQGNNQRTLLKDTQFSL